MKKPALFQLLRQQFHAGLLEQVLKVDQRGVASNADKDNRVSVQIARGIVDRIGAKLKRGSRLVAQTSGTIFEEHCAAFIERAFLSLLELRPGSWKVVRVTGRNRLEIAKYEQYQHLVALDEAAHKNRELAAILGSDYTISPDIIVTRAPEEDAVINAKRDLVDDAIARHAGIRRANNELPLLHASISCKWTIRSDRAQNSRTEALNLIRNRKGRTPHIAVVTGEPLPSRLASIAIGTGDIDCVYHFALSELIETVGESDFDDAKEMLGIMVNGKRLRDIADLPLDLAV